MSNKQRAIEAIRRYASGKLEKPRYKVEVYLNNPVGIGEHPEVLDAIKTELLKIAEYNEIFDVLDKYFED